MKSILLVMLIVILYGCGKNNTESEQMVATAKDSCFSIDINIDEFNHELKRNWSTLASGQDIYCQGPSNNKRNFQTQLILAITYTLESFKQSDFLKNPKFIIFVDDLTNYISCKPNTLTEENYFNKFN